MESTLGHFPLSSASALLVLLLASAAILKWKPSGATLVKTPGMTKRVMSWMFHLADSSFVLSGWLQGNLRAAVCLLLLTAALIWTVYQLALSFSRKEFPLEKIGVQASVLAFTATFLSIAIARSGTSEWSAGLEMHYGYLVVALTPLSWIVFSESEKHSTFLGLIAAILIVAFGQAFAAGAIYRFKDVRRNYPIFSQAALAIGSKESPATVTDKFMPNCFFIDLPETRTQVTEGIAKLRTIGGPIYGLP